MVIPCAHRLERPKRGRGLTGSVAPPAGNAVGSPHPASVGVPGTDGREHPARWCGLAGRVRAPADDRAVSTQRAGMVSGRADCREVGRERCRLARGNRAPAGKRAIHAHRTGMGPRCVDRLERASRHSCLTRRAIPPALEASTRSYRAGVMPTGAHVDEGACGRRGLTVRVIAATDDLALGGQAAEMAAPRADGYERLIPDQHPRLGRQQADLEGRGRQPSPDVRGGRDGPASGQQALTPYAAGTALLKRVLDPTVRHASRSDPKLGRAALAAVRLDAHLGARQPAPRRGPRRDEAAMRQQSLTPASVRHTPLQRELGTAVIEPQRGEAHLGRTDRDQRGLGVAPRHEREHNRRQCDQSRERGPGCIHVASPPNITPETE